MNPQIITVDDIRKSIEDIGLTPFANSLVQEMGGDYFYVEAELLGKPDYKYGYLIKDAFVSDAYTEDGDTEPPKMYWQYKIWPVPIRLAWFVIDALKLKGQVMNIGSQGYDEGRQRVYLPAGVEIFGKKVERLTEIPAEMRPVVVERL